jgi:FAD/FMN-containing dehydrogenase
VTDFEGIFDSKAHLSWGQVVHASHKVWSPTYADQLSSARLSDLPGPFLGYGLGRSYGDTCLNPGRTLIDFHRLNRLISADWESGIIRATAGLSLDELLRIAVPKGWFLPVTPGTKFVTLGGAVANDVHGKDHHKSGSFGHHVRSLGLLRSDQTDPLSLSKDDALYRHTIGGLGLSGLITWVEIQLKPIQSAYLDVEDITFENLDGYFRLVEESADYDYTVSWLDCTSAGNRAGRGIFSRASFSDSGELVAHKAVEKLAIPVDMPSVLLNRWSVSAFNSLYYGLNARRSPGHRHYDGFFYPLDMIGGWNKMYGRRGFYQYQCVIPTTDGPAGTQALLQRIQNSGAGSFLTVLKTFGDKISPGSLSFPGPGVTLALDFANKGQQTLDLLAELDGITEKYGGRNYAAKDGRISGELFRRQYPEWQDAEAARDPKIMSAFWARVLEA